MKVKDGFMLREVAGHWVALPLAEHVVEFNGIMSLSESGAMIWRMMEQEVTEDQIVSAIKAEYDADEATIRKDVKEFIEAMKEKGLLDF